MLRPFRSISPTVDPTAYIDSSAQVIGDGRIGAESSIGLHDRHRFDYAN
jgi:carbonic anhydrase/acetyltransferase-like protein (isoleucine patch superfamily)